MSGLDVSTDATTFKASVQSTKSELNRALVIALNRTANGVRAEASRMIRSTIKISAKEVSRSFKIKRAYFGSLRTIVRVTGRPLNIIGFKPMKTQHGLSANISGKREQFKGAFIATMPSGFRGAFQRRGPRRLPIDAVVTVSLPEMFRRQIITGEIARHASARFKRELASAASFLKRRAG